MKSILALIFGLAISLILASLAGENPWLILKILTINPLSTPYDIGMTLSYATPLILCGLSVCVAFHAGLFNIGAEGQMTLAVVTAAAIGVLGPQWGMVSFFLGLVGALLAGTLWGAIAGLLKSYRQSHEVITTMMLNFIAVGLANWLTLHMIANPQSQNPESALIQTDYSLKANDLLAIYFKDTPLNNGLIFAVVLCFLLWIFLWRTPWGYELRAVGYNPEAASRYGISIKKYQILALSLSGFFAAWVAYSEVFAGVGQYRLGFSPEYGFMGIAVALLAQNNPLKIIPSALLFAVLHKGATDLDLETTYITRDFSRVLQALVILSVSGQGAWQWLIDRKKNVRQ
ncbi:MAG: ABC transporter permease [Pseudobdellovibrionaceae bacterium]